MDQILSVSNFKLNIENYCYSRNSSTDETYCHQTNLK